MNIVGDFFRDLGRLGRGQLTLHDFVKARGFRQNPPGFFYRHGGTLYVAAGLLSVVMSLGAIWWAHVHDPQPQQPVGQSATSEHSPLPQQAVAKQAQSLVKAQSAPFQQAPRALGAQSIFRQLQAQQVRSRGLTSALSEFQGE